MSRAHEEPYLRMRDVSKTFGKIRALKGVSLDLRQGEIHSLMGENGAGKSTLMKILSGAYRPDPGSHIEIGGRAVDISNPMAAKNLGVSIIYQELSLASNLTASENIHLGRELRRGVLLDRVGMARATGEVLSRLGASFTATTRVADLSIAERQLVEIARAIYAQSRILVMDEPTTALSERETARLFTVVRRLREEGLGIVYISHRMNEIYELSDRVSVLRDGSYVGTLDRAEIDPDRLVRMMVGRDLSSFYTKQHARVAPSRDVVLRVRDLSDGRRVKSCSFDAHACEVLGIAGLVGAGRTELARLIYGADRRVSGTVALDGRLVETRTPQDAIAAGIAYLTEDRKQLGLFLDMSVADNVNVGVVDRDAFAGGFLNRRKGRERASASVASLGIRAASIRQTVGGLSGGNQQKVLLSRLLQTKPRVLILDEPTRGVDIGAKSEIYKVIDDLAQSGMAIIVISSELPEIVGICDRVLVLREGEIAGEVGGTPSSPITQERIVALATAAQRVDA